MAIYTSTQNGWWDLAATWGGGGTPGNGDTAIINHIVGIRSNITVGTDAGATTDCILFNTDGAKLIWGDPANELGGGASPVNASWTLTLKGIIEFANGVDNAIFQIGTETYPIPAAYTATVDHAGSTGFTHYVRAGKIRIHGYPSYHMADSTKQKTSLAANAAAGTSQLRFKDAVSYQAGDVLWLGTGGDPTQTPTACEKVTINAPVDAYTYNIVGVLANNHFGNATYGDLVIHATRNVIFTSSTSNGYSFRTITGSDATFDVNWARFESAGYGTTYALWEIYTPSTVLIPTDNYIFRNNVYDTPDVASSLSTKVFRLSSAAYFRWEEDKTYTNISENHSWNWGLTFDLANVYGRINLGHVSIFEASSRGIIGGGYSFIDIKGLWYFGENPASANCACTIQSPGSISDFKIHSAYGGINIAGSDNLYLAGKTSVYKNGEIFHMVGSYGFYTAEQYDCGFILLENIKFYDAVNGGLFLQSNGVEVYVKDCTFDNLNTADNNANYPIGVYNNSYPGTTTRFDGCDFGLESRNYRHNVLSVSDMMREGSARILFNNCRFKEPINYTPTAFDWMQDELLWASRLDHLNNWKDWTVRCHQNAMVSFEYIDCEIQNSIGVDQWPVILPDTNMLGIISQGAEIHKTNLVTESNGYIDGTFRRKILPFMGTTRLHATRAVPIRIPVTAGQIVSVTLSLKKNISQLEDDCPRLHLEGCGIDTYETMDNSINSWDEITVNGTAIIDGTVLFWVSCRGVPDIHDPASPPVRAPVGSYNYAYPIDPGGTGTGIGTPKNLILYCDGLSITRV